MSNKIKDIDIKNPTYYFIDDIMNIKNFDPNNIKKEEKSYKSILIYYIGYLTIKNWKCININSVNTVHVIFNNVNGYFEKMNGNKYLTPVLTNGNKEKIENVKNCGLTSDV